MVEGTVLKPKLCFGGGKGGFWCICFVNEINIMEC